MTLPIPLDQTPRRRTALLLPLTIVGLLIATWALTMTLLQTRAERTELEHVIAFRDCVGRVTDLMIDANADQHQPTLMQSASITMLCDTLTLGGIR
jgi:hypothetical protein